MKHVILLHLAQALRQVNISSEMQERIIKEVDEGVATCETFIEAEGEVRMMGAYKHNGFE